MVKGGMLMTTPIESPLPAPPRPRGAQKGNRNALRHGFYARLYNEEEGKELAEHNFTDLNEEISIIRLLLRGAAHRAVQSTDDQAYYEAIRAFTGLINGLNATLRTQIELGQSGQSTFNTALGEVLQKVKADWGI
jgi:hypothetical protein